MDNPSNSVNTLVNRSENLNEIYQGVLVLLIETDKKRDQILLFYSALVAALITFLSSNAGKEDPFTSLALSILFVVFSIVLGVVIIIYRKWHSYYVKSMIVLSNIYVNHLDPNPEIIQEIWAKNTFIPQNKPFIYRGAEWWIFNAYLIISFIPLVLTSNQLIAFLVKENVLQPLSPAGLAGITVGIVILYITLLHALYKKYAEEPERKFNAEDCWVLRLNQVNPKTHKSD